MNIECNYNCSYCKPLSYKTTFLCYEKWIDIWQDIYERYGSCHIHISGGEPFIYPDFFKLISELIKMHTLEFSTNLSWDLEPFIKNITLIGRV
jgi:molybdenum cofactor biosynthesis enzyme MoaA